MKLLSKLFAFLAIIFFSGITFISCSKDDDDSDLLTEGSSSILGHWYCQQRSLLIEILPSQNLGWPDIQNYDKAYRLWYIVNGEGQSRDGWNRLDNNFGIVSEDVSWKDYTNIETCNDRTLKLKGQETYTFERITQKRFFELIIGLNDIPNSNLNNDGYIHTLTPGLLCKNGGIWKYEYTSSLDILKYPNSFTFKDVFNFTTSGRLTLTSQYESKSKPGSKWETSNSFVGASGTYEIVGETLKCVFNDVICSGESDLLTKYWKAGETNYKDYKIEYKYDYEDGCGYLSLISGDENYYLENEPKGSTSGGSSSGGSSSGGSSSGDSGDFYQTNFSSTEYKDRIKVDFYFSENVSSAKIYYGTTSSCSSSKSATVAAKSASATITGLSSGTKYYFKCEAKSKSGQTCTTDVYPAMTLY